ncbi:copper resistance CopC family protein [Phytohabitans flavus]|uniref:copper resistance CopC family protein n=1 Tax=Phytohabitans flavus TaxID=1076124 RepID=UPI0031ED72DE
MNRYRLLSAATAALAAALVVVLPAAPASAHTELKSTVPAAKSTTTKPVAEVTLTFTGLIKKPGTTIVVTGPDKTSYSAGAAEVVDKTITQKVDALPVGAITVAWRTFAADGHPMEGSFTFTNQVAPPTPSAEPSPSLDPTTAPATSAAAPSSTPVGQASDSSSSSGVVWVIVAVAVLALAALGGLLWRRRRQSGT